MVSSAPVTISDTIRTLYKYVRFDVDETLTSNVFRKKTDTSNRRVSLFLVYYKNMKPLLIKLTRWNEFSFLFEPNRSSVIYIRINTDLLIRLQSQYSTNRYANFFFTLIIVTLRHVQQLKRMLLIIPSWSAAMRYVSCFVPRYVMCIVQAARIFFTVFTLLRLLLLLFNDSVA